MSCVYDSLTYLFRLCFTGVLADLNVPKTILAHRLQSSALSCICFQKKTQRLYLHLGFMPLFLLCLVGCKKTTTDTFCISLSHIFHHVLMHCCISLIPADDWPWCATDLPRGAGCTHTSEPVHTCAEFPF